MRTAMWQIVHDRDTKCGSGISGEDAEDLCVYENVENAICRTT